MGGLAARLNRMELMVERARHDLGLVMAKEQRLVRLVGRSLDTVVVTERAEHSPDPGLR